MLKKNNVAQKLNHSIKKANSPLNNKSITEPHNHSLKDPLQSNLLLLFSN